MSREYEAAIERELEEWPGVSVSFEMGGKHPRAVFAFNGATQFTPYPSTPSDHRGLISKLTEMRRILREMGAVKNERAKSDRPKSERNPGADMREMPSEPTPVRPDPWADLRDLPRAPLITQPGAYPNIDAEDYHRNPDLLPAPSLSSTGAKTILNRSPLHFWFDSPMNPERPEEDDKAHFAIGKAAHDMILLTDRWPEHYHVLPEGFAWNKTKAMPGAIAEAEAAREAGMVLLRHDDAETVRRVADALRGNELAMKSLTNGVTEETLAWKDPLTGVWLRARPDFRPHSIASDAAVRIVTDLKFMSPTYCSPSGFERAINAFGYHQSAAFYWDGIKAVYGRAPTHWLHVVVENEPPHSVSLYPLPAEDIERGRMLNRSAIDTFARCLERGTDRASWPGYADAPREVGLPGWARKRIDELATDATAWSAAA